MQKSLFLSLIAALCFVTQGCVKEQFGPELEYEVVEEPRAQLEAIPPQIEILEQVRNSPTEFTLAVTDTRYAWERAELFFKKHTAQSKFSAGKGDSVTLSNSSAKERITYMVEKHGVKAGTRFSVRCSSSTQGVAREEVNVQCRNLARFIREGVLEESFVYR